MIFGLIEMEWFHEFNDVGDENLTSGDCLSLPTSFPPLRLQIKTNRKLFNSRPVFLVFITVVPDCNCFIKCNRSHKTKETIKHMYMSENSHVAVSVWYLLNERTKLLCIRVKLRTCSTPI